MLTVTCLLGLSAFILTIISTLGRVPLWIPVLVLTICELLRCVPLR